MDSTALVDAFLAESEKLTHDLPFAFLAEADTPFDLLALPPVVYLRWAANRDLLVDAGLARKIIDSASPEQALDCLRAMLGDQVHLHALRPQAQTFTTAYYRGVGGARFSDEFFGQLSHYDQRSTNLTWQDLTAAAQLLDERFQDWQNGNPWKPIDDPRFVGTATCVSAPIAASPMLPEAWIDRLASLSADAMDHVSSVAYADHFYATVTGPPTDEMVQAAFHEFCRSPPHDTSMMQSAVNFLGAAQFSQYARVYAKVLPALLAADPGAALDMFDYPGAELDPDQVDYLINEIVRAHPGRDVVASLASVAINMGTAEVAHLNALVAAAGT